MVGCQNRGIVYCNGIPKSGTHILLKLVGLLGYKYPATEGKRAYHRHDFERGLITGPHIFIKRDPRNILISWIRYVKRDPNRPEELLKAIKSFHGDRPLRETLKCFMWLAKEERSHLVVRFEDILSDGGITVESVIKYLGEKDSDSKGIYKGLWGNTNTYTGEHSDWRKYWTPKIERVWESEGLIQLSKEYGYGP